MPEPSSGDYVSRIQEYQQRLERLTEAARSEFERQAPEVLDKMAATARNIAQRFDEMAREARRRAAEKEGAESAGVSERAPEGETEDTFGL
jgi:hypothetical protein